MSSDLEADEPAESEQRPQVSDPDQLNDVRRLEAIHTRWDRAVSRWAQVEDAPIHGDVDTDARCRALRSAVEQLLAELSALGEDAPDDSPWNDAELGTLHIPLPEEIQEVLEDRNRRVPWGLDIPEVQEIEVVGLGQYLEIDWPLAVDYGREVDDRGEELWNPDPVTVEPPISMSKRALIGARRFMAEHGIDFETGGEADTTPDPL